jgi:hypothetical protein
MRSFSLKKRARAAGSVTNTDVIETYFHDEDSSMMEDDLCQRPAAQARLVLEDAAGKAHRLKQDGILLAESERYKAAVALWDQAIMLTPADASLWEMKCQALNEADLYFPAVQVGDSCTVLQGVRMICV